MIHVNFVKDPKSFMDAYDRGQGRYDQGAGGLGGRSDMRGVGMEDMAEAGGRGNMGGGPRGRWGQSERRADDYPSKRRRY